MSDGGLTARFWAWTLLLLASSALPSGVAAQAIGPADPDRAPPPDAPAIGLPQLRDFDLQGTRVIPVRPEEVPPIEQKAPAQPPATRAQPQVPAEPIERRDAPPIRAPQQERTEPATAAPNATDTATNPSIAPPVTGVDAGTVPEAIPPAPLPPLEATPDPLDKPDALTDGGAAFSWTYALAGLAGLALAGLAFLLLRQRRSRRREDSRAFAIVDADAAPEPLPAAAPAQPLRRGPELTAESQTPVPRAAPAQKPSDDAPAYLVRSTKPEPSSADPALSESKQETAAGGGTVGIPLRPWLELHFNPERATTTETETSVQFELVVANTGNAPAHNVRVDMRMFNAGPQLESEIQQFFDDKMPPATRGKLPDIPGRSAATAKSFVAMPKDKVRELEVNGRRLFIPTIAFIVHYEWGSGRRGRTSISFLVGRQPEAASAKMGPLRLDQGPRIYRQLGQRASKPAVLV